MIKFTIVIDKELKKEFQKKAIDLEKDCSSILTFLIIDFLEKIKEGKFDLKKLNK